MENQFVRCEKMIGNDGLEKLRNAHVAVFGVGGVGGFCVEALVRSGIGMITVVDHDDVAVSNLNRQIISSIHNIGEKKVEVIKKRIHDINPECQVITKDTFYLPEIAHEFDFKQYDYVIDCIDTVSAKIDLIIQCQNVNTPIISCMGAGNKLDPSKFQIADIYKTTVCPLAKVMRRELKKRRVKHCKVVYSTELPYAAMPVEYEEQTNKRSIPGSMIFSVGSAGLLLASEVVKELIEK